MRLKKCSFQFSMLQVSQEERKKEKRLRIWENIQSSWSQTTNGAESEGSNPSHTLIFSGPHINFTMKITAVVREISARGYFGSQELK